MCVMKTIALVLSALVGAVCLAAKPDVGARAKARPSGAENAPVVWKLRFTEDFKGKKLNEKLWTRIDVGASDWNRNMSLRPDLVAVKDGQLHVYGVKNDDLAADKRSVLTGGISTKGHFAVTYGKVEIKCRLEAQRGAWPAIWMMPERPSDGWPNCGEIDIIERLNFDA